MMEHGPRKLIEKTFNSPSIEVRYFRDYWKILFPWVLVGQTSKSDLKCLYCDHCQYDCNLKVKKFTLENHQKSKKHQYAELVAKEDGIFIEQKSRSCRLSCNGSDKLNGVTRPIQNKKKLVSKIEKNLEVDRCNEVEKVTEVIQNQFLPPDLEIKNCKLDSPCARLAYSSLFNDTIITTETLSSEKENFSKDRCNEVEKATEVIQNQFLPPNNEDLVINDYIPCSRLAYSSSFNDTVITPETLSSEKENLSNNSCHIREVLFEAKQDNFSSDSDDDESEYCDLDEIVSKVTKSFKIDLMQLVKKDRNLREEAFKRRNVLNSEKGIDLMTKLVVGQLSHKFLTDNLNEQCETGCPSYTKKSFSSQFSSIEQNINKSYEELHKLQTRGIFERASSPPHQIIIEAVDYNIQEDVKEYEPKMNRSKFLKSECPLLEKTHSNASCDSPKYCEQIWPLQRCSTRQETNGHIRKSPATVRKNSNLKGLKDKDQKLRDKLKENFSWLEEDPSDFSLGLCNLCQQKYPFKRQNLLSHERSKKHIKVLLSVERDKSQISSEDVAEATEPPLLPVLKSTPPAECSSNNQAVITFWMRSKPLGTVVSEPSKSDNDNQHKQSYCDINSNAQIRRLAASTPTKVPVMDLPDFKKPEEDFTKQEEDFTKQEEGFTKQEEDFTKQEEDFTKQEEDFSKLVANICSRFSLDLKDLLKRNQQLRTYMSQNKEISKGKKGIVRLKKILVGHLAQYYLSESTVALWKHNTATHTREHAAASAKLEDIQLQMERSIQDLEKLKAQIMEKEKIDSLVL